MMSEINWHQRYSQQARWTEPLRHYLFQKAGLASARRILEVGSGTGAILSTLTSQTRASLFGLDLSLPSIKQAVFNAPGFLPLCANGQSLPFAPASFDLTFCHYVLLWVASPLTVLREMARVTRPGGVIMAIAEPDYGGRIDYPSELSALGRWQTDSLRGQGADPEMGRKLAGLFARAGLAEIETGVLGGGWTRSPSPAEHELEWQVLMADLSGQIPAESLQKMRQLDEQAAQLGERVLFVPTFYAWGRV